MNCRAWMFQKWDSKGTLQITMRQRLPARLGRMVELLGARSQRCLDGIRKPRFSLRENAIQSNRRVLGTEAQDHYELAVIVRDSMP